MLIYDGDCGFCRRSAGWAHRYVNPRMPMQPWQDSDLVSLGLTEEECRSAVQWVDERGHTRSGGAAVCAALRTGRPPWPMLGVLGSAPGIRAITEACYRWVARNRHRF